MTRPPHSPLVADRRLEEEPLAERVYQELRDAILSGVYMPGDQLVQLSIAASLGVSRTPVRDALLRLSQDGLIAGVGSRGYTVVQMSHQDILNIYQLRLAVEVPAAVLALEHVSPHELDRMRTLNQRIAQGEKASPHYFELNRDFHLVLAEACPNRLMRRTLQDVWAMAVSRRVFEYEMAATVDIAEMAREHDVIINAVEARNAEALSKILTTHLQSALDTASDPLLLDGSRQ